MATARQERSGEGALARMADDEPVFVLRARDHVAGEVVRYWADRACAVGSPNAKVGDADAIAEAMDEWRSAHGGKVPD